MFPKRPSILGLVIAVSILVSAHPASPDSGGIDQNLSCVGLDPPGDGVITGRFGPGPNYSGHWGIDYRDDTDGHVRSAAGGEVTFSGLVVGNLVVTVDHGGGLKTSYSYLDRSTVSRGRRVGRGMVIGRAGRGPLHDDFHFSVRLEGEYIDPERTLGCLPRSPSKGLRLVPVNRS